MQIIVEMVDKEKKHEYGQARTREDIFIFPGMCVGIESLVEKHDSRLVQQRKH